MGCFSIWLLAVGLAMDSFAVSIAGGFSLPHFTVRDAWRTALVMGIAQAGFFIAGFWAAATVNHLIAQWDHWIAFVLLVAIGGKMIFEHKKEEEDQFVDLRRKRILGTLAIATSIDALAVGISFSFLASDVWETAFVIGLVSFVFSGLGVFLGAYFSKMRQLPTYIIGGGLLIAIGVKILIEHLIQC